ncbi:universal stress protein [Terasakiella sp. A23]|uniref:universal stress protein n=1 Tax=Terasakiella sp. FCG-A23 TaxID=3080561 RepID=UPI0029546441|nr:universal stress protein [Terasakiella sp. A23]MDV7339752.1 universal stress protein [Terasakiella sp. A23]
MVESKEVHERVFLVVVDDSEEMNVALRFAAKRAKHSGGRVALLYVIEPAEFQHWMFVGTLMAEEAREEAEKAVHQFSEAVQEITGEIPMIYIREGNRQNQLMKLLKEEPLISLLVLAAADSADGPGPLVSSLTGDMVGGLPVPITVVPATLSEEDIDRIT